jgi:hypothetical protein
MLEALKFHEEVLNGVKVREVVAISGNTVLRGIKLG